MNQDRLYQDFPRAVRCESSHTIVFVAIPDGARYGDVRKTLAGLLQQSYSAVNIASLDSEEVPPAGTVAYPLDADALVPDAGGPVSRVRILVASEDGVWVTD